MTRATCHCWMRTLHPTKTGVAQIARLDPMDMRSRFPVAPVHDKQYGRAELLMRLQDPITSNTAADHRMLRKFKRFYSFTRYLLALDTRPIISRSTNRTRTAQRCSIKRFKKKDAMHTNKQRTGGHEMSKSVLIPCWHETFCLHVHDRTRNVMMIWYRTSDGRHKMSWWHDIEHQADDTYVGILTFHRIWDGSHGHVMHA